MNTGITVVALAVLERISIRHKITTEGASESFSTSLNSSQLKDIILVRRVLAGKRALILVGDRSEGELFKYL